MMDWQESVVRRTVEGAGEDPAVQLELLLRHLEACPEALPHIADAVADMGHWHQARADELKAKGGVSKPAAEIINLPRGGK